jgi:hypothetical protein
MGTRIKITASGDCPNLLRKVKEGENFNHRNTLSISRIKI